MDRDLKLSELASRKLDALKPLTPQDRLAHVARKLEHHTRIQRVIEAQRARKLRHG
jgi:hypothetical protein